ncbi:MAG TPA: hypothetical protein VGP07_19115 [Polyangia bacterium]|jgi:hypothetical protein
MALLLDKRKALADREMGRQRARLLRPRAITDLLAKMTMRKEPNFYCVYLRNPWHNNLWRQSSVV